MRSESQPDLSGDLRLTLTEELMVNLSAGTTTAVNSLRVERHGGRGWVTEIKNLVGSDGKYPCTRAELLEAAAQLVAVYDEDDPDRDTSIDDIGEEHE